MFCNYSNLDEEMIRMMEGDSGATLCSSPLLLGNESLLIDVTFIVSFPGIVEMLSPQLIYQILNFSTMMMVG